MFLWFCTLCAQVGYAQVDTVEQTICLDSPKNLLLKTENIQLSENQMFIWIKEQNGVKETLDENGWRISIFETQDATYISQLVTIKVKAENNLMENGGFETIEGQIGASTPIPSTFSSSYDFAGWDPKEYYDTHAGASNLYAISRGSKWFSRWFATVVPHGGDYLALFDAGTSGDAWRASTADNPKLVIEKDTTYLFSYYAAHPNLSDNSDHPAQLQFEIKYIDTQGVQQTVNLGQVHTLGQVPGKPNDWELREERWKAPCSSNNVTISVKDLNTSSQGNDFCLDDIMFQKVNSGIKEVNKVYVFRLTTPKELSDTRDTTVCDTLLPYTWLGHTFTEAGTYVFEETIDECNSIKHDWTLHVETCCPPITTDVRDTTVCDTLLPYTWLGHTFTEAETYVFEEKDSRGCDIIKHDWTLQVKACCPVPVIGADQLAICSEQLPYTWHGIVFTVATDSVVEQYDERDCLLSRYTYALSVKQGVEMYGKWTDVIFVPNPDNLYTAYQWYHEGQAIEGATEQFYHAPNGLSGHYHCVMQTVDGGSAETCPATFEQLDRSADHNPGDPPKQMVAQRTYTVGAHLQIVVSIFDDNTTTAEKYWR